MDAIESVTIYGNVYDLRPIPQNQRQFFASLAASGLVADQCRAERDQGNKLAEHFRRFYRTVSENRHKRGHYIMFDDVALEKIP